jgi:hypothetical protein
MTVAPLFTMLTKQRFCVVSFVKKKKEKKKKTITLSWATCPF